MAPRAEHSNAKGANEAAKCEGPELGPSDQKGIGRDSSNSRRKHWLFRLGALLVGLLPFIAFECVLIGIDWRSPSAVSDPFVGFSEIRPLFVRDGDEYKISDSRQPLFRPESFAVEKPTNEFRIFCIGGSTVQGRPFAIETSFSTWLEKQLSVLDDSHDWNAINCGGVSYASYRLTPIMREVMNYEPDLIVLYTGHNEFLEDRTYQSIKATSPWILRTHDRLSSLRSYSFLRSHLVNSSHSKSLDKIPVDVEARLDFRGGLEQYERDDVWKENIARHFQFNLDAMVLIAREHQVPIILCNPVCNLRDVAPFKSESSPGLKPKSINRIEELWSEVSKEKSASLIDFEQKTKLLRELVQLDPRRAEFHFWLGKAFQHSEDFENARRHFEAAKEEDICPLRATQEIYQAIDRTRLTQDVAFVDVVKAFEQMSPDGMVGKELLVDHVHPSIYGHQVIAGLIVEKMRELNLTSSDHLTTTEFETKLTRCYAEHLKSLPVLYFELGKDRLAGLKRWVTGKVTREQGEPLK